jgi:hypothetical protein
MTGLLSKVIVIPFSKMRIFAVNDIQSTLPGMKVKHDETRPLIFAQQSNVTAPILYPMHSQSMTRTSAQL